jgi:hypothetical protein
LGEKTIIATAQKPMSIEKSTNRCFFRVPKVIILLLEAKSYKLNLTKGVPSFFLTVQGISSSTHSANYGGAYPATTSKMLAGSGGELAEFFEWYLNEMPRLILRAGRGYLRITYYHLSLPLIVRTLFAPWRRDVHSMEGLPLAARFQVLVENLMSRFFGLIIRTFVLVFGGLYLLSESLFFVLIFGLWFAAPLVAILLIALGVRLLGGGQ